MSDVSSKTIMESAGRTAVAVPSPNEVARPVTTHVGRYRWTICALLFFATTLNYMDRSVLALLLPTLQDPVKGIGLTPVQYGIIVSIFSCAYAIGYLIAGNFIDRIGAKKGYATAVAIWSVAAMGHFLVTVPGVAAHLGSGAQTVARVLAHLPFIGQKAWVADIAALSGAIVGFGIARFLLGLGESGNFPASIKTVAEWFPKKERALATGVFNSGTNIGATIAPIIVGFVAVHFGWRYAFLGTSMFAGIWLVLWLTMYRRPQEHPKVSPAELAYICSDPPDPVTRIRWANLLRHRQAWAFVVGKVITDPIWWFFLFWLPGFLNAKFGLSIMKMVLPLLIIWNLCTVGSVVGGWLPARFLSMGWSLNRARKVSMFIYACAILPIMAVGHAPNIWVAIALISLATSAHQAWSANLFTLPSDMFPRKAVASVVGIGGFGGALAMMFFGTFVGFVLEITKNNYAPLFVLASSAYLLALLIIHLLVPKLSAANLD